VQVECRSDPEMARLVREVFTRFETLLMRIVETGVARGELRADTDPAYVAWRLIDLGLFRNQVHLMRLEHPGRIRYATRALDSLLAEIAP